MFYLSQALRQNMKVEAKYNWRGELVGYRRDNSHIPLDYSNTDFREIQDAISSGHCKVDEPTLGNITRAFDRNGICSGYNTAFGFVSTQNDSRLTKLIAEQIDDGRCVIINAPEPLCIDESLKVFALNFCVMLERPLPHITAEFHGEMSYSSNEKKTPRTFEFNLKNLPIEQPCSKLNLVFSHYKVETLPHINSDLLQFGVIEVKVPVDQLRWLFQGERQLTHKLNYQFLHDLLAQHYAMTGRKPSEGPDIEWLINNVSNYLQHFIVEFCNRALEAFNYEYGQLPQPYVSEQIYRSNIIVFGCSKSGKVQLQNLSLRNNHSFSLSGEWSHYSIIRFQEESTTGDYLRKIALRRVSDMMQLGLHAESLALINSFLEVTIKKILRWATPIDSEYRKISESVGYKRCLEILEKIAEEHSNKIMFNESFAVSLKGIKNIYRQRNIYIHALELDEHIGRLTLSKRRLIESMLSEFIDIHRQQQFLMRLDFIVRDTDESHKIIHRELKKCKNAHKFESK